MKHYLSYLIEQISDFIYYTKNKEYSSKIQFMNDGITTNWIDVSERTITIILDALKEEKRASTNG